MSDATHEGRRNDPDSVDERLRRSPATPNELDATDESQKAADITRAGGAPANPQDARKSGAQRQDLMNEDTR